MAPMDELRLAAFRRPSHLFLRDYAVSRRAERQNYPGLKLLPLAMMRVLRNTPLTNYPRVKILTLGLCLTRTKQEQPDSTMNHPAQAIVAGRVSAVEIQPRLRNGDRLAALRRRIAEIERRPP